MRNPIWTREEMILAADFANRLQWTGVNPKSPGILELSELLKRADFHPKEQRSETFRSINSVSLKINNLRASHPSSTGVGLRTTKIENDIVQEFISDPNRMTNLAASIRERITVNRPGPHAFPI